MKRATVRAVTRDRYQALASDPSAPMGPQEDIFSTSGGPESRMNTTSIDVCCEVFADLSKTLKLRRCGRRGP
eukprot:scaffold27989_cov94-Isochrysis_galbana.AAC.3